MTRLSFTLLALLASVACTVVCSSPEAQFPDDNHMVADINALDTVQGTIVDDDGEEADDNEDAEDEDEGVDVESDSDSDSDSEDDEEEEEAGEEIAEALNEAMELRDLADSSRQESREDTTGDQIDNDEDSDLEMNNGDGEDNDVAAEDVDNGKEENKARSLLFSHWWRILARKVKEFRDKIKTKIPLRLVRRSSNVRASGSVPIRWGSSSTRRRRRRRFYSFGPK
eukprot:scpid93329/ scgid16697/ 